MKIKFSRHAVRRAKLYGIPLSIVEKTILEANLVTGEQEIVAKVSGMKYPLKIVVTLEGDVVTVITNYPLKKGVAQ